MSVENIQFLTQKLDQEHTSHLKTKTKLSQEINELKQKELELQQELISLKNAVSEIGSKSPITSKAENTSQLVQTVKDLEKEIIQNQQHSIAVETELTHERVQLEMIKNKIEVLKSEKEELEIINRQKKQEQLQQKSKNRKVQAKRERLAKLRTQIEKQEKVKSHLSGFIYVTNLIEQIVQDPEDNPDEIPEEVRKLILEGKEIFLEALDKFSANNITPFLQVANQAYQMGIMRI